MATIQSVSPQDSQARADAQFLFRQYGEFLRGTGSCGYFDHGGFDHAAFAEEIARLPGAYADQGGELLLARVDGFAAACIAYRASNNAAPDGCEIKRLYVAPSFRFQGLARKLVAEVLSRAAGRGFRRVILDTDVDNMPGAAELYESFGFKPSGPQKGSIAFFTRPLP
jgi:ribosomal protein S18 acetylase RimI-like enzyme